MPASLINPRSLRLRIVAEVDVVQECVCTVSAILRCEQDAVVFEQVFGMSFPVAFRVGDCNHLVVMESLGALFGNAIDKAIETNKLNRSACSVFYECQSSKPDCVECYLSIDGTVPHVSHDSMAWARLLNTSGTVATYRGLRNVEYRIPDDEGIFTAVGSVALSCPLVSDAGTVYPLCDLTTYPHLSQYHMPWNVTYFADNVGDVPACFRFALSKATSTSDPFDWLQVASSTLGGYPRIRAFASGVGDQDDLLVGAGEHEAWELHAHAGWYYTHEQERYWHGDMKYTTLTSAISDGFTVAVVNRPVALRTPFHIFLEGYPHMLFREIAGCLESADPLMIEEEIDGSGYSSLPLAYSDVYAVRVQDALGSDIDVSVGGNLAVRLDGALFELGSVYTASYRVRRSYVVERGPNGVRMRFDQEYNNVTVGYVPAEAPSAASIGISMDPGVNPWRAGFVRLTDTLYPLSRIEVHVGGDRHRADGISPVVIIVCVYDSHGNPRPYTPLSVSLGGLAQVEVVTDQWGCARAQFLSPGTAGTYTVRVSHGDVIVSRDIAYSACVHVW